nr:KrmQ [uncultured bacterium]
MSELSEKIASLSPEQRAVFDLKLKALKAKKQQAPKAEPPKIIRQTVDGPLPLSLDQERLWFINQFAPENAAYNIHTATRLIGNLDMAVLEKSFNAVIQRHDVLRTSFVAENGQPKQVIAPSLQLSIPIIDLQHLSQAEQDAEAMRHASEEAEAPFDLSQAPLMRVWLLKMSLTEHVLYFNQHHIITDWWSAKLLFQEMATFYEALLSGQLPVLPEPYQYKDFVLWERERVENQDMARSLAYWRKHLAEGTFQLDLPIAHRRPVEQTFGGRRQWVTIPPGLAHDLKAFSRRENVTLFITLTAAFKMLLFRYTGQTDITLGTPLANRSQVELERVLGFLITMLVLHTDLSGALSFKELVHKVRQVILEAYAHQDVPFAKILEIVQLARDWSRNPIFQFSFIFIDEFYYRTDSLNRFRIDI